MTAECWWGKLLARWRLHSVPVHEIYQHLRVLLVLLHLDCVREDHVQVEHKVLDLEAQGSGDLELLLSDGGAATEGE